MVKEKYLDLFWLLETDLMTCHFSSENEWSSFLVPVASPSLLLISLLSRFCLVCKFTYFVLWSDVHVLYIPVVHSLSKRTCVSSLAYPNEGRPAFGFVSEKLFSSFS